jgi:hypothetical protein
MPGGGDTGALKVLQELPYIAISPLDIAMRL